ncbi:MAG: uroporphyrinogen decarboxylase [Candidatus Hydrogenedentes bacterium]|nr:uroporphyrinogen decarboxylase [Candidatus Hydrogenedentota bacterium]
MPNFKNDLLLRAARGETTPRTPIWMMRQAGRTDPEYNKLKETSGLPLHELFCHPELAAQISLLPKRIGVDAIIYFQDILTPLAPMGAAFAFNSGPEFEKDFQSTDALDALHLYDVADELPFIPETFRLVYEALDGELPVLGFAGAPLTLAVFLIQGGSFGKRADRFSAFQQEQPEALRGLLDKLTDMTIDYLRLQIEAGAAAWQLFESAAYLFTTDDYREFALPYQQRIFDALRGSVPTIMFARDWSDLDTLNASGADILSLAATPSIAETRHRLGADRVLQGNLDNRLLVTGSKVEIAEAARECIRQGEHRGHIFNLSHGLLRETPFENVCHLVDVVKNTTFAEI